MNEPIILPPNLPHANLEYRKAIGAWALASAANRAWLLKKCGDDFLFFLKTFGWVHEPRPERVAEPSIKPFIPWPSQEKLIAALLEFGGFSDVIVEKARGEGATWVAIDYLVWRFLFHPEVQILGMVSRTELVGDSAADPNSLGFKIDWALAMLPEWMMNKELYERNLSRHTWQRRLPNDPRQASSITSFSATDDLVAGGRLTCLIIDEFARFGDKRDALALRASEAATNSRIILSTYNGIGNAYYSCVAEARAGLSDACLVVMDWRDNPLRNKDMFLVDARAQVLRDKDTKEPILEEYGKTFFSDDYHRLAKRGYDVTDTRKVFSPWYISRCLRPQMSPRSIAQEYDRDPGGSGMSFFPDALISLLISKCQPPWLSCDVVIDEAKLAVEGVVKLKTGSLKLWLKLRLDDTPPPGKYTVGADIASGQGGDSSSNSVASIADSATGVKVAEYASSIISPEKFCEVVVALCKWFHDEVGHPAYLVFENNGHTGEAFGARLLDTNFSNFHWHIPTRATGRRSKIPGWRSGHTSVATLLSHYRFSLVEGFFDNPSEIALREASCYVHAAGDKVIYKAFSGSGVDNPAAQGKSHGDRVIADALANFAVETLNGGTGRVRKALAEPPKTKIRTFPPGSYGWRQKEFRKNAKSSKWSPLNDDFRGQR